jgi:hypothetical protein
VIGNDWAWVGPTAVVVGALGGLLGGTAAAWVAVKRKSIESYVRELDRVSYEHEVVFSRLHERRVDVVNRLYGKLVRAERAFSSWIHPLQEAGDLPPEEKAKKAVGAANEFIDYFLEHRIWLDPDLCVQIMAFADQLRDASATFNLKDHMTPLRGPDTKLWLAAWGKVNDEIPPIRERIEAEFRQLLGVHGAGASVQEKCSNGDG